MRTICTITYGLKHRLFSAEAFQLKYGAPRAIIQRPGELAADATPVDIFNSKKLWDAYDLQQSMDGVLEAAVEGGYPSEIRAMLERDFTLDHLTLEEQCTQLSASHPTTAADIVWLMTEIAKPWSRDEKIETCTAKQLQYIGFLTTIGQAPAPLEAIRQMWSAYTSTAQDKADFASCMIRFREQRPALVDQTPDNFAASVIFYVNNLLPAEREANVARRLANSATEVIAAATDAEPELAAFRALMAKDAPAAAAFLRGRPAPAAAAAAAPAAAPTTNKSSNKSGAPPAAVAAAPPVAGRPRPYCHTCGVPPLVKNQHFSNGCLTPKAGHNWDATYLNQMGGKKA